MAGRGLFKSEETGNSVALFSLITGMDAHGYRPLSI